MRSYKLGEFVAHEGAVNCLRIGRNTAGVLATGGEDKKVHLWRIGQHEAAIKTLCGLQSPVECVNFDTSEEQVAAGTANGTVKVWDLETGKVHRSLVGHRSNCLSLEFHPFGPFLASGSLDTNVKVWDLRRKEAVVTFKDHASGVRKLAVSPDGKWLCSGSEDGDVKLWDAMSGRVVKDGWRHEGRITGMEFHPAEFLLATSGADKTVRVWDLETWEQVESLGPEATGVQAIAYHRDGRALLSATADALKVWGTEPAVHHDTVPMDWRHLMDMHLSYKDDAPRAVGCCASGSAVGVFLVDLRKVAPFCHGGAGAAGSKAAAAAGGGIGSGGRAAQLPGYTRGGLQQAGKQQLSGADDTSGSDKSAGTRAAAAAEQEGPAAAGPLTRQLPRQRTPPKPVGPGIGSNSTSSSRPAGSRGTGLQGTPPFLAAAQPGQLVTPESQQQQHKQQQDYFPDVEIRVPARRPSSAGPQQQQRQEQPASSTAQGAPASRNSEGASSSTRPASGGSSSSRQAAYEPDLPLVSPMAGLSLQQQESQAANGKQPSSSSISSSSRQAGASRPGCPITAGAAAAASAPVSRSASRSSSAVASRAASAHDLGSGMQQQAQQQGQQPAAAAADPILAAMASRPQLKGSLARMGAALQVAKGFVGRGNLEGAYRAVLSQGDAAIAAMLLEAVSGRADAFELSSLEPLIKLVELLLASGQEQQVAVGLSALGLVLRGPGQVVAEVCGLHPQPVGVDLSYEARRSKCLLLKMALEGLGMKLGVLGRSGSSSSAVAPRAQLLGEELRRIVAAGGA